MSDGETQDDELPNQRLLAYREMLWALTGFTAEQAKRNMDTLAKAMKRLRRGDQEQERASEQSRELECNAETGRL